MSLIIGDGRVAPGKWLYQLPTTSKKGSFYSLLVLVAGLGNGRFSFCNRVAPCLGFFTGFYSLFAQYYLKSLQLLLTNGISEELRHDSFDRSWSSNGAGRPLLFLSSTLDPSSYFLMVLYANLNIVFRFRNNLKSWLVNGHNDITQLLVCDSTLFWKMTNTAF